MGQGVLEDRGLTTVQRLLEQDLGGHDAGGVVVRDRHLPALAGRYVYGDYCTGVLHSFRIVNGKAVGDRRIGLTVPSLSSFGEDTRGRVYATSLNGVVYRLSAR